MSVCQRRSVNIVLCSSNSSSSCSAVAARSTVYFPSWRTTSYQISRHCLQVCCPTTRSQRVSRLLFSRLSYRRPCSSTMTEWQRSEPLTPLSDGARGGCSVDKCGCASRGVTGKPAARTWLRRHSRSHIHWADVTDDTMFFALLPWQHPQFWQLDKDQWWLSQWELYESIWALMLSRDTWREALGRSNISGWILFQKRKKMMWHAMYCTRWKNAGIIKQPWLWVLNRVNIKMSMIRSDKLTKYVYKKKDRHMLKKMIVANIEVEIKT